MKWPEMPIHSFTGRSTATYIYIFTRILSFLPCSPAFFLIGTYSTLALSYLYRGYTCIPIVANFFPRNCYVRHKSHNRHIRRSIFISEWTLQKLCYWFYFKHRHTLNICIYLRVCIVHMCNSYICTIIYLHRLKEAKIFHLFIDTQSS